VAGGVEQRGHAGTLPAPAPPLPGSRQYRIVDPDTGEGAGWVGYWHRDWGGHQVFEIGWSGLPSTKGRGLARAATAQVIEIARAEHEPRFLHAFPSVDNAPSNAICRRLGFQLAGPRLRVPARYHHALQRTGGSTWPPIELRIFVPGTKLDSVHKSC
jgi:RimJ/RimL family protein N-acetyltransferase